jgi:hypothetical protein
MSMNTTQIGDITEQKFILYCLENSIPVSKPVGNNLRYDCIIDVKGRLLRIQIKTGFPAQSKEAFTFKTSSTTSNLTTTKSVSYEGSIDYFVTCYPELGPEFYIMPVDVAPTGFATLYYGDKPDPNRKNAKDFLFSEFLK